MPPPDEPDAQPIRGHRPGLADWLDLLELMREDEGLPDADLRRRDRAIGARVAAPRERPERWLVAWVVARREAGRRVSAVASGDGARVLGERTADAVRWGAALLGIAGAAFGASAAFGALSFQPQGRINVVAVLGVLVGMPGLFLLLALLNALPTRLRRVLPWVGSEPEGGGWLQPARFVLRALPRKLREPLKAAFARGRAAERLAAPIQRWLMLSVSQGAAVAFQVGALMATLALVVFSDLSFGWSTTLRIDGASVHRVTSVAAAPWARLWPDAVPTIELIEQTRFFRIAGEPGPDVSPSVFGRWWPFVVAALVCYGLIPRAVFFIVARVRLARGLVVAMQRAPGARRVLGRMQDPLVETRAQLGAGDEVAGGEVADAGDDDPGRPWTQPAVVVSWADAVEQASGAAPRFEAEGTPVLAAGGRLAPSADLEAARSAAERARRDDRPVAVVVRAFEPPVLEVLDFLTELRRQLGDGLEIVVGLAHASPEHAQVWRRRLASIGDPWLESTTEVPLDPPSTPNDPSRPEGEEAAGD